MGGGGRGIRAEVGRLKENKRMDKKFDWIKDVPTDRLNRYIHRSLNLRGHEDPQGRSIHLVGDYAIRELQSRAAKAGLI